MAIYRQFLRFWQFILEFIFPKFCVGCKKEGEFLCEQCLETIPLAPEQLCSLCDAVTGGIVCGNCERNDFFLDGLWTASSFTKASLLQTAIHAFKYEFLEDLSQPLGKLLIKSWGQMLYHLPKIDVACPVPLHPKRFKFRGFNQAEHLLQVFGKGLELSTLPCLKRISFYKPQMELTREQRQKNVEDAFAVSDNPQILQTIQGASILIIDDVATTLSTLNQCAKTLKRAGAKAVYGLVLARVY